MSLRRVVLAGCLVIAGAAHAQVLYKSTMPDGRVIYGDKPAPGAAKVETRKPDTSDLGTTPPTDRERELLRDLRSERRRREAGVDRVSEAEEALRRAEAELAAGKEPLPGERLGTAKGGSRLTDQYWERQKKLEEAVKEARRQLEEARARR